MFQLFLRARTNNYLKERLGNEGFRARSAERDAETDRLRVGSPSLDRSCIACGRE